MAGGFSNFSRRKWASEYHRLFAVAALVVAIGVSGQPAKANTFGAGVVLGDPSGLSFKLRLTEHNAFQLHFGYGFGPTDSGHAIIVFEYLYHVLGLFPGTRDAGLLAPYVGVGGKLGIREAKSAVNLAARFPLGLSFLVRGVPLELFIEAALGVNVLPSPSPLVDGGLGVRWYF